MSMQTKRKVQRIQARIIILIPQGNRDWFLRTISMIMNTIRIQFLSFIL